VSLPCTAAVRGLPDSHLLLSCTAKRSTCNQVSVQEFVCAQIRTPRCPVESHIYAHVHTYMCAHSCIHTYRHACTSTQTQTHTHAHEYTNKCMRAYTHTHIHTYTLTQTHTCTHHLKQFRVPPRYLAAASSPPPDAWRDYKTADDMASQILMPCSLFARSKFKAKRGCCLACHLVKTILCVCCCFALHCM